MEGIKQSLSIYVEHRMHPGVFLVAVLSNNLFHAFEKADHKNQLQMHEIVKYIYNNIPRTCWGSKEIVESYLRGE